MGYDGALITAPQTMTTSWADVGGEVATMGFKKLHYWLEIDINNSNNLQLQLLDKHTTAGSEEYSRPIITTSASVDKIEAQYFEFNADEDKKYHLIFDLDGKTEYVQLQAKVGTLGVGAAQLDTAYYSLSF